MEIHPLQQAKKSGNEVNCSLQTLQGLWVRTLKKLVMGYHLLFYSTKLRKMEIIRYNANVKLIGRRLYGKGKKKRFAEKALKCTSEKYIL